MWLLIILLARHLHAYGELSINYCERRLKVFFFSGNHLAFPSHDQILHAFNYSDISLVASVARRRNRYPNLKVVQNKGSYTQKLIRGRIWGKYKFVLVPFLPFCPFALLPVCPFALFALLPFCPFALLPFCPFALLPLLPLLPFCPFSLLHFCPFAFLPFCVRGVHKWVKNCFWQFCQKAKY